MKDRDITRRAVHIAAKVLTAAGMCIHENPAMCKNFELSDDRCDKCIEKWLLSKARAELKRENA